MEGIQTLKVSWPWPSIRPYGMSSCISHRPLPIYQLSFKLKKLFVDGRTYGWTDIFPLYITRSTLGSRPNNNNKHIYKALWMPTEGCRGTERLVYWSTSASIKQLHHIWLRCAFLSQQPTTNVTSALQLHESDWQDMEEEVSRCLVRCCGTHYHWLSAMYHRHWLSSTHDWRLSVFQSLRDIITAPPWVSAVKLVCAQTNLLNNLLVKPLCQSLVHSSNIIHVGCITSSLHQSHESFSSNDLETAVQRAAVLNGFTRRHHHTSSNRVDRVRNQTRRNCHHFTYKHRQSK